MPDQHTLRLTTPSDEESPRYKVSEKNFRFDESTIHKSTLLILNVSIVF